MTDFDIHSSHVFVEVIITGPRRSTDVVLALDTGAMRTTIRPSFLRFVGLDPDASGKRVRLRSMTGGAVASIVDVFRFETLDQVRTKFPVVAHELPSTIRFDGVLGLDFFRGQVLTLDFARGRIRLRPPWSWWPFSR